MIFTDKSEFSQVSWKIDSNQERKNPLFSLKHHETQSKLNKDKWGLQFSFSTKKEIIVGIKILEKGQVRSSVFIFFTENKIIVEIKMVGKYDMHKHALKASNYPTRWDFQIKDCPQNPTASIEETNMSKLILNG